MSSSGVFETQVTFANSMVSGELEEDVEEMMGNFNSFKRGGSNEEQQDSPVQDLIEIHDNQNINHLPKHITHKFIRCKTRNQKDNFLLEEIERHIKKYRKIENRHKKEKVVTENGEEVILDPSWQGLQDNGILICTRSRRETRIITRLLRLNLSFENKRNKKLNDEEDNVNPYSDDKLTEIGHDPLSMVGFISKDQPHKIKLQELKKPIVISTIGNVKGTDFATLRKGRDFKLVLLTQLPEPVSDYFYAASRIARCNSILAGNDNNKNKAKSKIITFVRHLNEMQELQKLEYLFRTEKAFDKNELHLDSRLYHHQSFLQRKPVDEYSFGKRGNFAGKQKRRTQSRMVDYGKRYNDKRDDY